MTPVASECAAFDYKVARFLQSNPAMFFVETDEGEKIATATAFYDIHGRDTSDYGWLCWVAVKWEY